MNRRSFLQAILAAGVAPSVVGSGILMPVRAIALPEWGIARVAMPDVIAAQKTLNAMATELLHVGPDNSDPLGLFVTVRRWLPLTPAIPFKEGKVRQSHAMRYEDRLMTLEDYRVMRPNDPVIEAHLSHRRVSPAVRSSRISPPSTFS